MKRLIAAILITSYLAACTSWRVQEVTPQRAAELRITLADGRHLVLRDPQASGDSLVGFAVQEPVSPTDRVRVAFLTADLQRIEAKKVDASKTALAVIALGVVIGVGVALGNIQTTDPNH